MNNRYFMLVNWKSGIRSIIELTEGRYVTLFTRFEHKKDNPFLKGKKIIFSNIKKQLVCLRLKEAASVKFIEKEMRSNPLCNLEHYENPLN